MDIVAVLTKVVQEQEQTIATHQSEIAHMKDELSRLGTGIEQRKTLDATEQR